jgi:hypothetical protein
MRRRTFYTPQLTSADSGSLQLLRKSNDDVTPSVFDQMPQIELLASKNTSAL